MRNSTIFITCFVLLSISACSSSSTTTPVPLTTPTPRCKDNICIQQVIASVNDTNDLFVNFILTDQEGKVNTSHPPFFTQDWLTFGVYRLEADQTEKTVFEQLGAIDTFYCDVSNNYKWAKGQLSVACGISIVHGGTLVTVQSGDHLKIKLKEFDFEQVVEVNKPIQPSTAAQSGIRLILAASHCPGTLSVSDLSTRLKQTAQIVLDRLNSFLAEGLSGSAEIF